MDEKPERRWFWFRISTVLILTAIATWGMACWPWWWHTPAMTTTLSSDVPGEPPEFHDPPTLEFNNSRLHPALALAAFLAWKAAWAVVERRRARHQTLD